MNLRNIVTHFFVLMIFLFYTSSVLAADIPGVNCGIAEAPNGANKCCFLPIRQFQQPPIAGQFIKYFTNFGSRLTNVQQNLASSVPACSYGNASGDPTSSGCVCELAGAVEPLHDVTEMCNKYVKSSPNALKSCVNCALSGGYPSAIGCIPLTLSNFIMNFLLSVGIGFGGMYAMWCIIYSSIKIQLSRGKAETVQKARENITSCILGLLLIIFSVFLLRVIGINLLTLPGFS